MALFHVLWNFLRFTEFSIFCGSFRFPFFVEFSTFYGIFHVLRKFPFSAFCGIFRILRKFCMVQFNFSISFPYFMEVLYFLFISSAIFHAIYDLADKKRVDFIVARHAFCITKYHLARGHP